MTIISCVHDKRRSKASPKCVFGTPHFISHHSQNNSVLIHKCIRHTHSSYAFVVRIRCTHSVHSRIRHSSYAFRIRHAHASLAFVARIRRTHSSHAHASSSHSQPPSLPVSTLLQPLHPTPFPLLGPSFPKP